jgi:hypothetical protein
MQCNICGLLHAASYLLACTAETACICIYSAHAHPSAECGVLLLILKGCQAAGDVASLDVLLCNRLCHFSGQLIARHAPDSKAPLIGYDRCFKQSVTDSAHQPQPSQLHRGSSRPACAVRRQFSCYCWLRGSIPVILSYQTLHVLLQPPIPPSFGQTKLPGSRLHVVIRSSPLVYKHSIAYTQ